MNNKKLGFGLMRLPLTDPNTPTSIDKDTLNKMIDAFLESGFTYFDTAWMYCGFESENAVKSCLVDRHPRNSFTLADKLHAGFLKEKSDVERIFSTQLEKTGAIFFDYYLLHDMRREHFKIYEDFDCFNWLKEKKREGIVKKIGFSFHDTPEFLDEVLTKYPDFDFVQLQINYLDWDSDGVEARKCYQVAVNHNMPVVVMEPVKGGTLVDLPKPALELMNEYNPKMSAPSWAIRFAASLNNVFMVLSGMSSLEQVYDNTGYMSDFKPLNDEEQGIIKRVVDIINSGTEIPCTACSYCTDGCPMNIPIPKYFSLYNRDIDELKSKTWNVQGSYYNTLTNDFGKASDCIACGQCEAMCPQHISIIKELKKVAEYFEK